MSWSRKKPNIGGGSRSGKAEQIVDRIVEGKLQKFYEESCLMQQPFIKDTSITVGELVKQKNAILVRTSSCGALLAWKS